MQLPTRRQLTLLLVLLSASFSFSQSQAVITGNVSSITGTTATSGIVQFTLAPFSTAIQYRVNGVSTLDPIIAQCSIDSSGNIKDQAGTGPCLLWGNDNITPANTCYQVGFNPNGAGYDRVLQGVQITGASVDLASPTFCPSVRITPEQAVVVTDPINSNFIPGVDNFFNVGTPTFRYQNGYFTNLSVSGGVCTGCGGITGSKIVDGVLFTTIQSAITAAGSTGSVLIASTYAGTDTYTNPSKIQIVDLRPSANRQRGYINVLTDCGLKGDGVTDDSTAANTCFGQYPGATFYFPPTNFANNPSYFFASSLAPTGAASILEGASGSWINSNTQMGGTVLKFARGVTGINLAFACGGCIIRDLALLGQENTNQLVTPSALNIPSGANLPQYTRSIASIQRTGGVLTVSITRVTGIEGLTQQVGSTIKITGVVGDTTMNGLCVIATLTGNTAFGGNPNGFTCAQAGSDSGPFTTDGQTMLPTTGASTADAIRVCTNFAQIIHVSEQSFGRHGVNADSLAGHGCALAFSDDLIIRDSIFAGNQGDGYYCAGVDCNAHLLSGNAYYYSVLWGIEDQSSLGNTHIGEQISNNGSGWAASFTPTTKAISTISRTLSASDSTVTVVLSSADTTLKLGTCVFIAGVTDSSFNTTAGQCFFITSFTDSKNFQYIQPGQPANASSSGGTERPAKFAEAYLSAGIDSGAAKIGTQSGVATPTLIGVYAEGGQACKFGPDTLNVSGVSSACATSAAGDWIGGYITMSCPGFGGALCLNLGAVILERDGAGNINFKAGVTADQTFGFTWLNHSNGIAWSQTVTPTGTLGGAGSFEIRSGTGQTRFILFGKDTAQAGATEINSEGASAVRINRNFAGTNAGTGGLEVWSGGASPAKVGSVDSTGLGTFNGGVKAGSSGSTIADTRALVQSVFNCGSTTACANTANGSLRIVTGTVALASATPSAATITGISPAFTSTATYNCTATPEGASAAIAAGGIAVSKVSGSSFTLTGPNTVTTVIDYTCIGS